MKKDSKLDLQTKSQVSMELVITFGFALLMLIPLTILLYEHTSNTYNDVSNNQAGLIARKITDSANSVYYLGHPSTITLKAYMPEKIQSINISQREIIIKLTTGQTIVSTSNVNMTGYITPDSGLKLIKIAAMENYVNVTFQ